MAITVQQSAPMLSPIYNDVVYILSSSNVAQDNFKFIADIYVGGVMIDRLVVPPHPTHLTGYINIAPVLEGVISRSVDIDLSDDAAESAIAGRIQYVLKFGESYGSSGTIYTNLTTLGDNYLWNSVFDYEDYCSYSSGDYTSTGTTPGRFFTNKPSSGDIMADDNAWLYWWKVINPANTGSTVIKTFNSAGALIATHVFGGSHSGLRRLPTGANNINNLDNGLFVSGGQPVITASVAKYSIQVFSGTSGTGNPVTEEYFYTIVTNCSIYEKKRIVFLNKLGGYDTFDFTLVSKKQSDIERSTYKKGLGSYASANSFIYSPSDRSKSQFYTKVVDKFTITSDWLSEDVANWLEELVTSPDVYLDNGTNLIPINVTNPSFDEQKTVNRKMFNLTLDYTISYDRYRQRL